MTNRDGSLAERAAEAIVAWRWLVIAATLAVVAAFGSGVGRLGFNDDYRFYYGADNPELLAQEEIERDYTRNDNLLFVLQLAGEDALSSRMLAIVHDLTERAWHIPYATRIDSVTNFQHTSSDGDELFVRDLVPDPGDLVAGDVERVRKIALNDPRLVNSLISASGETTGVNARILLPGVSNSEAAEAVAFARDIAADLRRQHRGLRVEITGTTMMGIAATEASAEDSRLIFPIMLLLLIGGLLVLLRSIVGAVATMLVVVFSAVSAMGVAGWLGIELSPLSMSAPTIILTIAIADSVHVLSTMFGLMADGRERCEAIKESMVINAQAVFLTSLTTFIGFLSLNLSDSPPLQDLGSITALGVVFAWLYAVAFLPAALAVFPLRPRRSALLPPMLMDGCADFVVRYRKRILPGMAIAILVLGASMSTLQVNDQPIHYYDESIEFRRATDFAVENLTGFFGMSFSLPADGANGIGDPAYLSIVERFVRWLRQNPNVEYVVSITDTLARINENMHGDDPQYRRIPESRELVSQYLLLYEMSLPFGFDLHDRLNVDRSATLVSVVYDDIDFRDLRRFKADAESWLQTNGIDGMRDVRGAGSAVMFAYLGERNINAMLIGTAIAFALISLVLAVALRAPRIGLLSIIPNVVPIVMTFGIWSLLVGEVDFAVSIVASVAIGIIVDGTIHSLAKYLRARRDLGYDSASAVRYALCSVGNALLLNALILVVGFSALAASTFWPNTTLGLLTAMAIFAGLIADFFMLPPLLMWLDGAGRLAEASTDPVAARPAAELAAS